MANSIRTFPGRGMRRSLFRPAAKEEITGWLFASPWIIGFLLFMVGPMLFSLYTSFTEYNIIRAPKWIGLENYSDIFQDQFFYISLKNTLWMVAFKTPVVMVAAIALAMLLNQNLLGEKAFRTIIYLPNVLSGIAAIFLWQWILSPNGLFNRGLDQVGINGPSWFFDPNWTKPGMVVMGMWWIGGNVLIYLSGLKGIPKELYEAAEIDGASSWPKFRHITLPLLTPVIFFQVVTGIIGAFQIFTTAYILSDAAKGTEGRFGGPGMSLLFYVLYLYNRAFGRIGVGVYQMGYASALAWILFVIILTITFIQLRLAKRWVFYETDR
jgi:multiple sugar transport system permease protein